MGGVDKPLMLWRGEPLVAWVCERLAPQVDRLWISANDNIDRYAVYGTVIEDRNHKGAGPLAGIRSVAEAIAEHHGTKDQEILTVPGDAPSLPATLAQRLRSPLQQPTYATTPSGPQPLHHRVSVALALALDEHLAQGERSVRSWLDAVNGQPVPFGDETAFININTLEDLVR